MFLKLFNSESKTIFGAAALIGVLSFLSRIVGLIRDRILAGAFGAGDVLDAYYAAFKLPDLLFSLIVIGSLSASFIPLFTKYYRHRLRRDRAWELTNNTLHLIGLGMAVISIVLIIFAQPLAALMAPGFPLYKQTMVAGFMRVTFLAQIILAGSVVYGSALQGMRRFFLYSLAPVLYNVGIIIGAVWLVDIFGPIGLAWGVVLGAFLHFLVQFYGVLQAGYHYAWVFNWRDSETRQIIRLAGPRMLGVAISQVNVVLFTVIASTLAIGSVTVFQFAYNIQFFTVGIIGVSFAVAAFPLFAEYLGRNDLKKFISLFSATIRQALFFIVPMMILFLIVRAQVVRVVVGAGEFDWAATITTADTLAFFALSFIPQVLVFILARAFFALHDTVTPLVAGVVSALVGLISAFWLTSIFGVVGLGMAFSLSAFINALLLWVPLRQRTGSLDEARILLSFQKFAAAGLVAAVVMQSMKYFVDPFISLDTFWGVFGQGLIAGGLGLAAYGLILFLVKSEELHDAINSFRRKILRSSDPEESISTESPTAS
ncbi:murein biosynthesis integral membrane protein MurJ [Patescibacteria group bacterium]|nr:murein biosynthesis integral membrane protein MurJ [Patescibacteria group bacterium]MBU1705388.1 murein biosynthesis integral membrane protein MurJ [Patescibacteria group bacterium]